MDYRCPVCRANLGKTRLGRAIIVRMEIECSHCRSTIRLNVHRSEAVIVLLGFGTFVALAACAYWFQSQRLALLAFGAAMLGALALPLLEQTYLRTWPRFASAMRNPGAEPL